MSTDANGPLRVVVVDDDPLVLAVTRRLLTRSGYEVVPCDQARTALREIMQNPPFALVADLHMPDLSGAELLRLVRSVAPKTRRILYTGESHVSELARAMAPMVADAIVSKVDGVELLPQTLAGLQDARANRGEARSVALGMARALASSSVETLEHALRVSRWACRLGRLAGLDEAALLHLELGALLHDVGMICVSEASLRRQGPLAEHEWQQVQQHPRVGMEMLRECELFAGALPVVLHHHERFDGRGYPDRLSGAEIPLAARLFAVVDTYEALTGQRPYARPMSDTEARAELAEVSGSQLDPELVRLFLSIDSDDWKRPSTPPGTRSQP